MFITKKNRLAVYHNLFKEGVLVAKKDNYSVWSYKSPEGDKDLALPNLEVVNLMKSLKSSGYVKETFNWQFTYYYLTAEGIEYLRQYLNLPQDVVPQTHSKKEGRPARPAGFGGRGDQPEGERRPFDKEKRLGPDGSFAPSFGGGGFGRGGGGNREYRG
ncbi:hypothetical protein NSK_001982 [Nannochloropsis salina CCMP1776]|uniref:Plectin/eS10 N-terminal domain-containing protein n=1 Tax=Nannochloropsis salina CCMP1776 TaxID=1027361 RepID=A0A4D9D794_9STRA|nr:hypothetical protein NSK_001982 [Nannochloropsis salina CCMP1776]|eukprot:TFJ86894.1 hypothetical protein NSK_001982 [Nannochloropsis salina CCMP1776]